MNIKTLFTTLFSFILFINIVYAGNYFNLSVDFEDLVLYQNTGDIASYSCAYQSGYDITTEDNYGFNVDWCMRQGGCFASYIQNNSQTPYGSSKSFSEYRDASCGDTFTSGIRIEEFCPDDTCLVSNITRIEFDYWCVDNAWSGAFALQEQALGFYDASSSDLNSIEGNDYSFFANIKHENDAYCRVTTFGQPSCSNSWEHFNFTIADALSGDSDCLLDANKYIDSFIIGLGGQFGVTRQIYFDNLEITNIFNGTNQLPSGTYNLNDTLLCIDEDNPETYLTHLVDFTDPEGDTIYYLTGSEEHEQVMEVVFNNYVNALEKPCNNIYAFLCARRPVFNFVDDVYFPNGVTCNVTDEHVYISDNHNLVYRRVLRHEDLTRTHSKHVLELNQNCDGSDKSFTYDFGVNLEEFEFDTFIYGVDEDESFEISLNDDRYDPVLRILFTTYNDTFLVYNVEDNNNFEVVINKSYDHLIDETGDGLEFELLIEKNINSDYVIGIRDSNISLVDEYEFDNVIGLNNSVQYITFDIGKNLEIFYVVEEGEIPLIVDNPVIYIPFEESGSTILDHSGNDHDGTNNGATSVNGWLNYALDFDGINDYVTFGDHDDFTFGNGTTDQPFSVSAWIYHHGTSSWGDTIVRKDTYTSNREFNFYIDGSGYLKTTLYDDSAGAYIGRGDSSLFTTNQWRHVVMTYDGSGTSAGIDIFINGVETDDNDIAGGSYVSMENTNAPLEVGRRATTSTYQYYDGIIDELNIVPYVLNEWNISNIYNETDDLTHSINVTEGNRTIQASYDTTIYLDEFRIEGIFSLPTFSTELPINTSVTSLCDNCQINLYVTDSFHVDLNEYTTYSVDYNVVDCADLIQVDQEVQDALGRISRTLFKFCGVTDNVSSKMGAEINTCNFIMYMYLIIFFVISAVIGGTIGYMLHSGFGFSLFAILFGVWGILGSFLFVYPAWIMFIVVMSVFFGVVSLFFFGFGGGASSGGSQA